MDGQAVKVSATKVSAIKVSDALLEARCSHGYQVSCSNCRLGAMCLPLALKREEIDELEFIVKRGQPLQRGEHVFRENDPFHSIYAVRSGSLKSYRTTPDGQEQVTGFFLPGEIAGLDGIGTNTHLSSLLALETASVCAIPFNSLELLGKELPHLQRHFLRLMSREIAEDQQLITLLSKGTADQKVASFLLGISSRLARQDLSPTSFRLSMSRVEIGNYLGLTVETVSRVFSKLQKQFVLAVDNKEIELSDCDRLREIAGIVD